MMILAVLEAVAEHRTQIATWLHKGSMLLASTNSMVQAAVASQGA
jgi:hypothetical protein